MTVIAEAGRGNLQRASVAVTFDGTSGLGLAASTTTFFTVTGEVLIIAIVPYVTATLTQNLGTPSLALGVVNSTSFFIGATTATALTTGEFWTEATGGGTANAASALPVQGVAAPILTNVACTSNIVGTVGGTNNINGGSLRIDVWYLPLSSDGLVA